MNSYAISSTLLHGASSIYTPARQHPNTHASYLLAAVQQPSDIGCQLHCLLHTCACDLLLPPGPRTVLLPQLHPAAACVCSSCCLHCPAVRSLMQQLCGAVAASNLCHEQYCCAEDLHIAQHCYLCQHCRVSPCQHLLLLCACASAQEAGG